MWSNGLSVLSELVADAADSSCYCPVYETEKERIDQRTKKETELSVQGCTECIKRSCTGWLLCRKCSAACSRDLERLYPKETDIVKEFHYIETQLRVSVPVEELLLSLGDRSGIEDVENFAAVFYTAKRTGGDMNRIIQTSARMLGDKIDVRKEIETTLAAKKAEQMIMSLMPAGIILYLKLTSPGFLSVLYGNLFGMCAMTLCLGIYVLSYWLGRRIVDIEV